MFVRCVNLGDIVMAKIEVWHIEEGKIYCRFVDSSFADIFFNSESYRFYKTREDALKELNSLNECIE